MSYLREIYNDTYDSVYSDLINKKKSGYYKKQELIQLLDSLYANEGSSWSGKSEIQQLKLDATIAAHEAIIVLFN